MDALKFLQKLTQGGVIVSSGKCHSFEIAQAQACDRFFSDDDFMGYVYYPNAVAVAEEFYDFLKTIDEAKV